MLKFDCVLSLFKVGGLDIHAKNMDTLVNGSRYKQTHGSPTLGIGSLDTPIPQDTHSAKM